MFRTITILSLLSLCFTVTMPYNMNRKNLHDCYISIQNQSSDLLQCHTGQVLKFISGGKFKYLKNLKSQKAIEITSFHISKTNITRIEFLRYLKYSDQKIDPTIKTMNNNNLIDPIAGLNWKEADAYCRFFGMELPSEAQLEFSLFENDLAQKSKIEWEFTSDSFMEEHKMKFAKENPTIRSTSSYKTIRSLKNRSSRKRIQKLARRTNVGFRCTSNKNSFGVKEILLDYQKNSPLELNSEAHFLRIDSVPSGANIYEDPNFHHYLGKTPFYSKVEPGSTLYTLQLSGHKPKTVLIHKQKNHAQHLTIHFDDSQADLRTDPLRGNRMVLVPSGRITVGNSQFDKAKTKNLILKKEKQNRDLTNATIRKYLIDEGPKRIVYVKDFYMDETEVTNQQYVNYLNESGAKKPRCWNIPKYNQPNKPVVCVDWIEANSFCKFYGKSLPTEVQYDKAAKDTLPNKIKGWIQRPQEVATNPGDRSRYDIKDLSGNVMEWNEDWYDPNVHQSSTSIFDIKPYNLIKSSKVIRGASYASHRLDRRLSKRRHKSPEHFSLDLGFRCVQNL